MLLDLVLVLLGQEKILMVIYMLIILGQMLTSVAVMLTGLTGKNNLRSLIQPSLMQLVQKMLLT
nr:MAG TPA: hypothetical protein [Bacteriophage sp.]